MWFSLLEYPILQHRVPNRAFIVQGRRDYSWSSSQKPGNQGAMRPKSSWSAGWWPLLVLSNWQQNQNKGFTASLQGSGSTSFSLHLCDTGRISFLFAPLIPLFTLLPILFSMRNWPFGKRCAQTWHQVQPVEDLRRTVGCRKRVESGHLFSFCIPSPQ